MGQHFVKAKAPDFQNKNYFSAIDNITRYYDEVHNKPYYYIFTLTISPFLQLKVWKQNKNEHQKTQPSNAILINKFMVQKIDSILGRINFKWDIEKMLENRPTRLFRLDRYFYLPS